MFGFNCGVLISYEETVRLLQRGVSVYASPSVRVIDIIPSADDFADGDKEPDYGEYSPRTPVEDMRSEQACLMENQDVTESVASAPDVVSESADKGLLSGAEQEAVAYDLLVPVAEVVIPIDAPVLAATVAVESKLSAEPVTQKSEISVSAKKPSDTKPLQSVTQRLPSANKAVSQTVLAPPDISGMTLKGQAQAIAAWTGGVRTPEETLVVAFGKSAIQKLISEGYLIRTKKGIILGS